MDPLRRNPPHLDVNWVDLPAGLTGDDKAHWLEKLARRQRQRIHAQRGHDAERLVFRGTAAGGLQPVSGARKPEGARRPAGQLLRLRAQTQAHRRKGGNIRIRPGDSERVVRRRDGRKQLHRPAPGRGRSHGVGGSREVPLPRPATFCGGIGNYRLAASASPTALRVGDPLTLTLDIERGQGSGSLDLISAPDLAANPQVAADFEVLDKNPTGHKEGEVKRFEYALRPKRAGVGIPSLAVTVFNPDTEKFSEIATRPIALTVSAASRLGAGELVGSLAGSGTHGDQVAGHKGFFKT